MEIPERLALSFLISPFRASIDIESFVTMKCSISSWLILELKLCTNSSNNARTVGKTRRAWMDPKANTEESSRWKISARLGKMNPKQTEADRDIKVPPSTDTPTERRASIMRPCMSRLAESTNEWHTSILKFKDSMTATKREMKTT